MRFCTGATLGFSVSGKEGVSPFAVVPDSGRHQTSAGPLTRKGGVNSPRSRERLSKLQLNVNTAVLNGCGHLVPTRGTGLDTQPPTGAAGQGLGPSRWHWDAEPTTCGPSYKTLLVRGHNTFTSSRREPPSLRPPAVGRELPADPSPWQSTAAHLTSRQAARTRRSKGINAPKCVALGRRADWFAPGPSSTAHRHSLGRMRRESSLTGGETEEGNRGITHPERAPEAGHKPEESDPVLTASASEADGARGSPRCPNDLLPWEGEDRALSVGLTVRHHLWTPPAEKQHPRAKTPASC